jgi:peptidoglycan/LPS O-acetylase OafA/YrhL
MAVMAETIFIKRPPGTLQKKNLVSIDIARAFAALSVFFCHLQIGSLLARYSGIRAFSNIDNFGATYAVPLFFLISGYCIHLSNLKYLKIAQPLPLKDYYKRRLLRIYPAYVVALLFSVGANYVTHYNGPVNQTDFFVHLFMLQCFTVKYFNTINVVLWTIAVEFGFYIIYPLFYYLRLRFSLLHALMFSLIVSSVSIIYFSTQQSISISERYFFLNLWFSWCCGAYIADKKLFNERDFKKLFYKLFYALILLAFIGMRYYYRPSLVIINYQVNILMWTAPLLFLLNIEQLLVQHNSFVLRVFVAIGLSSYSLYLFHEPLISLKNFLVHQYLPAFIQPAGIILGIIIIPVLTWLSYIYFEKPFISKKRAHAVND